MPISLSQAEPGREAEVIEFLLQTFGSVERPASLSAAAVAWKYFETHPWWPGGRSYVLEAAGGIAAHGCISPVRFELNGGVLESMQIIDWAGSRRMPLGGLLLFQRCLDLADGSLLAVGGSADTLRILPMVKWFRRENDIGYYARPLNMWRIFRRAQGKAGRLRELAQAGRNLFWQVRPRLPNPVGWECRRASATDDVFAHAGDFLPILRTRAWFDYLLRCPVVPSQLLLLSKNGVASGHGFVSNAGGSVRVADFVVAGGATDADRAAAFSALVRYIAAEPGACEIVAASSLPEMCRTFEACGLRLRGMSPVFLADPRKEIPPGARLEITMLIGDAFYLFDPSSPFRCG